jgi:hypothetical protein
VSLMPARSGVRTGRTVFSISSNRKTTGAPVSMLFPRSTTPSCSRGLSIQRTSIR